MIIIYDFGSNKRKLPVLKDGTFLVGDVFNG